MYKPLYSAYGITTVILLDSSHTVAVDPDLHAFIASKLATGDWTYLRIRDELNTEIVRVFQVVGDSSLAINRGRDGTTPARFMPGTAIDYVDTQAGVLDIVTLHPLQLNALNAIVIDGRDISYPVIDIEVLGSAEVAGNVIIEKIEAAGCCGLNPHLPPPIPDFIKYRITDANDIRSTSENDSRIWV